MKGENEGSGEERCIQRGKRLDEKGRGIIGREKNERKERRENKRENK